MGDTVQSITKTTESISGILIIWMAFATNQMFFLIARFLLVCIKNDVICRV